jgi:hypothetical protein
MEVTEATALTVLTELTVMESLWPLLMLLSVSMEADSRR